MRMIFHADAHFIPSARSVFASVLFLFLAKDALTQSGRALYLSFSVLMWNTNINRSPDFRWSLLNYNKKKKKKNDKMLCAQKKRREKIICNNVQRYFSGSSISPSTSQRAEYKIRKKKSEDKLHPSNLVRFSSLFFVTRSFVSATGFFLSLLALLVDGWPMAPEFMGLGALCTWQLCSTSSSLHQ